jgi:2',3'-cyclic-nucleotide 2'-phosphodiesterase/3'-nucleotidase
MRRLLHLLLAVLTGPCLSSAALAETVTLRLLETSDLHDYILPYDYYRDQEDKTVGLAAVATLVKAARAEMPNSLLFDAGDLIQGNPMGDWAAAHNFQPDELHPMIIAMNAMGYDAATLGNHEFNFGLDVLDRSLKGARFPYVSANVLDAATGKPRWQPYVILDRELVDRAGARVKVRIGVIGGVTPQIMVWDKPRLTGKVTAVSIQNSIAALVPEIRAKGADIVIALIHSGLSDAAPVGEDENAGAYVAHIPGIDAVLTGHQHRVFPGPTYAKLSDVDLDHGTIAGVPVVMPGFWGSHLGVVDLVLERQGGHWRRVAGTATTRPIVVKLADGTKQFTAADPVIMAYAAVDHLHTLAYTRRPVGHIDRPIESYFALVADDPGVALVARAATQTTAAALAGTAYADLPLLAAVAPFRAGGLPGPDNYTRIPAGPIAIRNIADLYPYANTLTAIVVTGAQIREWLERSASIFRQIDPTDPKPQNLINLAVPAYNFDVLTGVTYAIDVSQKERYDRDGKVPDDSIHRVVDLRYQGRPVDPAERFVVATNNYRASGGGNFPGLASAPIAYQSTDTMQEIIAGLFAANGTIDATPIPTWRFAPLGRKVTVSFLSSKDADVAAHPGISTQGIGTADGFMLFQLVLD